MTDGPTELPLAGRLVCAVVVSRFIPPLRLRFWSGNVPDSASGPDYSLAIEGPMTITRGGNHVRVDPQEGPSSEYLRFLHKKVDRAVAGHDGSLMVEFADGEQLSIEPNEFEPWSLEDEDGGVLFVSIAGGGLASWSPDPNA